MHTNAKGKEPPTEKPRAKQNVSRHYGLTAQYALGLCK